MNTAITDELEEEELELKKIRERITEIDQKILELIAQRISLVPVLVDCKKKNGITIFQPQREIQMHQAYWKFAINNKINPELVRKIFEMIVEEMVTLQYEMMK